MFHPIYSTLLGHPELVADHLANYGALIKAEALEAKRNAVKKAIAGAVAIVAGLLGLVFAGVAIMLGGVNGSFHWVLVLVPGFSIRSNLLPIMMPATCDLRHLMEIGLTLRLHHRIRMLPEKNEGSLMACHG